MSLDKSVVTNKISKFWFSQRKCNDSEIKYVFFTTDPSN